MPLSQILIDGEGWKKVEGKRPLPTFSVLGYERIASGDTPKVREEFTIRGRKFTNTFLVTPETLRERGAPKAGLVSRDGGTVFIGHIGGDIWAYQAKADGTLMHGEPYCPVRGTREEGSTDPHTVPKIVTSMTGDKDGRIYAATPLGVQVFDPTGRLCGVLTPAATGIPTHLAFEGDKLTLWIGDQKYERMLNTSGVKQ
jgi:hypothetical protein